MAYKVTLNGANYVSEKRQLAFERALEGPKESVLGDKPDPHPRRAQTDAAATGQGAPQPVTPASQKAAEERPEVAGSTDTAAGAPQSHPSVDPGRVLTGLERGLEQSYDHQSETLRVHQHYLNNEAAYASIFAQLMQEQGHLFSNGHTSPEKAEVVLRVLDSLTRSIERFHEHQAETLDVHSQFLSQQAEFTQAYMEVLQSHYGVALSSRTHTNGHGNGHESDASAERARGNGNGRYSQVTHAAPRVPDVDVPDEAEDAEPEHTAPVSKTTSETASETWAEQSAPRSDEVGDLSVSGSRAGLSAPVNPTSEALSTALLDIVSDKTGYPAEMLELDMDMEADLGIDSIKRVEILGGLQDAYPDLPDVETDALAELRTLAQVLDYVQSHSHEGPVEREHLEATRGAEPAPSEAPVLAQPANTTGATATGELDPAALSQELLEIVSDKTGYPAEMLELDMDMEADLGIDSIKRVEILGALQERHPNLPEVETDALAELRSLAQVIDYVAGAEVTAKKV